MLLNPTTTSLKGFTFHLSSIRILQHSSCFLELDLDDNLIGDLGGRDIMEGLKARKEEDLPGVKVSVTHRMNGDTFDEIVKLGSGLQKKKKKKGKGKKVNLMNAAVQYIQNQS